MKCKLTGHELPARISDLENYTRGKKYQRLVKDVPETYPGFEEYKEFLVPSRKNRYRMYPLLALIKITVEPPLN